MLFLNLRLVMTARMGTRIEGMQIITNFISVLTLGLIFTIFVVKNEALKLPLILFTFALAFALSGIELQRLIKRRKLIQVATSKISEEDKKKQLAMLVKELYSEDFEEPDPKDHD